MAGTDLYFRSAWNAADAAIAGGLLWTLLYFPDSIEYILSVLCGYHCIFAELCGIFCRDFQKWNSVHSSWTIRASRIFLYNRVQMFLRIILPQVIKRILPAVTNETITLVKDTSLAFAIAYTELFTEVKQIAAAQTSMLPYLAAAIFYYVFNLLVAGLMALVEKKMNYYKI